MNRTKYSPNGKMYGSRFGKTRFQPAVISKYRCMNAKYRDFVCLNDLARIYSLVVRSFGRILGMWSVAEARLKSRWQIRDKIRKSSGEEFVLADFEHTQATAESLAVIILSLGWSKTECRTLIQCTPEETWVLTPDRMHWTEPA